MRFLQKAGHHCNDLYKALLHLAFPHTCEGCGIDLADTSQLLCLRCLTALPQTQFHLHPNNPVEKLFWGRLPVTHATAQYYFTRDSAMQRLMHQLKYQGNRQAGIYLGGLMGMALAGSNRFSYVDALVPLPLFKSRQHRRGYNQAALLCEGIADALHKPVWADVIGRKSSTESQTKKNRLDRWQNMEGRFELLRPDLIQGRHLLLVDDVVTTGATLEACGKALFREPTIQLSIATLCFSSR